MKPEVWECFRNLNSPMFLFGFTPMQIVYMIFFVVFPAVIYPPLIALSLGFVIYVGRKLNKYNKNGNPDYLTSLEIKFYLSNKKKIVDKSQLFNYLIRK